jgi:hypothetical protein
MPLDEFQKSILKILGPLRSPTSVFSGGSVMRQNRFRLSFDQDIFHGLDGDVVSAAKRDVAALRAAGFAVQIEQPFEGLVNAIVAREQQGSTKLQWVNAGAWNFFSPVPDPDFGYRLHMADLAVNKALAAGGRKQVRDYVDLFLIHKHIMPLWAALWAAPGKDETWSPLSLTEKIAMKSAFRQQDFDDEIVATIDLSAELIGRTIREALEEADKVFQQLPKQTAGKFFVVPDGSVLTDVTTIRANPPGMRLLCAAKGGAWPSGPGIDHALLLRVIEAFGWEGRGTRIGNDPSI